MAICLPLWLEMVQCGAHSRWISTRGLPIKPSLTAIVEHFHCHLKSALCTHLIYTSSSSCTGGYFPCRWLWRRIWMLHPPDLHSQPPLYCWRDFFSLGLFFCCPLLHPIIFLPSSVTTAHGLYTSSGTFKNVPHHYLCWPASLSARGTLEETIPDASPWTRTNDHWYWRFPFDVHLSDHFSCRGGLRVAPLSLFVVCFSFTFVSHLSILSLCNNCSCHCLWNCYIRQSFLIKICWQILEVQWSSKWKRDQSDQKFGLYPRRSRIQCNTKLDLL